MYLRTYRDATDMRQDVATLLLLVEVETLNAPDDVMQTLLKAKTVQVSVRHVMISMTV